MTLNIANYMSDLWKLMAVCLSGILLVGAFCAFANRKYLVRPDDDGPLKQIRKYGYIMFIGSTVLLLFMWLHFHE